ncbi:hypothetical protein CKA32_005000 [Geitlerinema sp. FC II]|nr:hypothetical protein CKA32_005000 [Geitlerinema sp. FC II]
MGLLYSITNDLCSIALLKSQSVFEFSENILIESRPEFYG